MLLKDCCREDVSYTLPDALENAVESHGFSIGCVDTRQKRSRRHGCVLMRIRLNQRDFVCIGGP